jgi:hypothetical protein
MHRKGHVLKKRYKPKRKLTGGITRLYNVTSFDDGEAEIMESVSLVPHASSGAVEHALSTTSGVYAPRGLDRLTWSRDGHSAEIVDASGNTIVNLDLSRSSR